jgi:PAS domain S-box-containing protein
MPDSPSNQDRSDRILRTSGRFKLPHTQNACRNNFITENILDVIWTIDMNLKYTYLSPSIEKLLGYRAEELLHKDIDISMTPESYAVVVTTLNTILSSSDLTDNEEDLDRFRTIEVELLRKDGSRIWAEIKAAFIRDVNRLPVEIIGVSRDISLRKKTADELKSSKIFLQALINSLDDPLFVKDNSQCWIMANDRACALLARPREEIVGKYDADLFEKERLKHIRENDARVFSTNLPHIDEEIVRWGGQFRTVSIMRSPYTDSNTGKKYVTAVIRDITAYKKMEDKLKHSYENLEKVIESRTSELTAANERLKQEIEVRKKAESELISRELELEDKSRALEEMNTALRILLKQRDEDRSDMESTIVSNLKSVVLPYVERLMASDLKESQKTYVSLIASYLKQITSSYIKELSSEDLGLPPCAIQLASLIKEGKDLKRLHP